MITTNGNKVCVNGCWIEVEFCDPDSNYLYYRSEYCFGVFVGCDAKIYLNNRMEETFCKRTLIHEITHAIVQYAQIEGRKDTYTEENVCEMMGMYAEQISKAAGELMKLVLFNPNTAKFPDRKYILSFNEEDSTCKTNN